MQVAVAVPSSTKPSSHENLTSELKVVIPLVGVFLPWGMVGSGPQFMAFETVENVYKQSFTTVMANIVSYIGY